MITIPKEELKTVIRESVREALQEELIKLRALFLPFVSQKEQKNIEKLYVKPSRNVDKRIHIQV